MDGKRTRESRVSRVFPEIVGESTSVFFGHPVVPEISEIEVPQWYRFDTSESLMFLKMNVKVDIVDHLANMDGTAEWIIFTVSFVMSGGDAID